MKCTTCFGEGWYYAEGGGPCNPLCCDRCDGSGEELDMELLLRLSQADVERSEEEAEREFWFGCWYPYSDNL